MLNANGPGFAGLYAGDVVRFYADPARGASCRTTLRTETATVLKLLVFADHVQVNATSFGYTVDASNFVRLVRRGKRHIAADKARTGFETLPYVRAADKVAEDAYDERLATVGIGPQEAYSRAITGTDPRATRKLIRALEACPSRDGAQPHVRRNGPCEFCDAP